MIIQRDTTFTGFAGYSIAGVRTAAHYTGCHYNGLAWRSYCPRRCREALRALRDPCSHAHCNPRAAAHNKSSECLPGGLPPSSLVRFEFGLDADSASSPQSPSLFALAPTICAPGFNTGSAVEYQLN